MDWKKMMTAALASVWMAFSATSPVSAAEEPVIAAEAPSASEQAQMTPEEALQAYIDSGYKYTSKRYGYSIVCPAKPTVVPLSVLSGDGSEKGEVLIFKSLGYDINYGWIVKVNAFDEETLPPDITKQPEEKQKAFLDKFQDGSSPFEVVRLTEVDGRSGIYEVTAKEMEVDTNGDGKMDGTVVAESQMVMIYFRGAYGGRFGVILTEKPKLTQQGLSLYEFGVLTFQEWPTSMDKGQNVGKKK